MYRYKAESAFGDLDVSYYSLINSDLSIMTEVYYNISILYRVTLHLKLQELRWKVCKSAFFCHHTYQILAIFSIISTTV